MRSFRLIFFRRRKSKNGLVYKKNPLLKLAYWAEYWLYKKADLLIFSMEGGKDYIKEKEL